jgi:hypothetical protein
MRQLPTPPLVDSSAGNKLLKHYSIRAEQA